MFNRLKQVFVKIIRAPVRRKPVQRKARDRRDDRRFKGWQQRLRYYHPVRSKPSTDVDLRHDKYLHGVARMKRRHRWAANVGRPYPFDKPGWRA